MILFLHPLALASACAALVMLSAGAWERATRTSLIVLEISPEEAPFVDGVLSEPIWGVAPAAEVLTRHGLDFGGNGESLVEIRAIHDSSNAYFAFSWSDPSRSVTQPNGREMPAAASAGETQSFPDKFAVLVAPSGPALIGAAIHLGLSPLENSPASATGRGYHYTTDGAVLDLWQWKASSQTSGGRTQNAHLGGPAKVSERHARGRVRYTAGMADDPIAIATEHHFRAAAGMQPEPAKSSRLPRLASAALNSGGAAHGREVARGAERISYSSAVPDVGQNANSLAEPPGDRDIRSGARWAGGRWTLEIVRPLNPGSRYDAPIGDGTLLYVAAFDHAQTRHTYHIRPIYLEMK